VAVVNARFVKPLDERLVLELAAQCGAIVTVEENVKAGGFGSAVLEFLTSRDVLVPTRVLAVPDRVFEQATQGRLRELARLTALDIAAAARQLVELKQRTGSGNVLASGLSVG
jgi:1-deoxy-D-xylulose-5-phosphate synthase